MSSDGNKAQKVKALLLNHQLLKDDLEKGKYPVNEIFEVNFQGEILGPFHQNAIINIVDEDSLFMSMAKVRIYKEKEWRELYHYKVFQRRSAKVVKESKDTNKDFIYYILKDGQKKGPYNFDILSTMVSKIELLYTDMVTWDDGKSWHKLYEIEHFDRRKDQAENLPPIPKKSVFLESDKEAEIDLLSNNAKEDKAQIVLNLASINNKSNIKVQYEDEEEVKQNLNQFLNSKNSVIAVLALFIAVYGIIKWKLADTTPGKKSRVTRSRNVKRNSIESKAKVIQKVEKRKTSVAKRKPIKKLRTKAANLKTKTVKKTPIAAVSKKSQNKKRKPRASSFSRSRTFKKRTRDKEIASSKSENPDRDPAEEDLDDSQEDSDDEEEADNFNEEEEVDY
jgi:hypothetical protein